MSFFNKVAGLYQKENPTQVLSCESGESFKNTYFEDYLQTTASISRKNTSMMSSKK